MSLCESESPLEPEVNDKPLVLQMPVSVRSLSLAIIALVALLHLLHWASEIFIPLMLGIMLSYALSPTVSWLQKCHLPRALGAALLLLSLTGGLVATGYLLGGQASNLIESLPDAAQKLRQSIRVKPGDSPSAIDRVQKAAAELERAAEESNNIKLSRGVTRVQIEPPKFNIKNYVLSGTLGLAGFIGQAVVVWFITYFLLTSGDSFRRKLIKLAGPTFTRKKITLQALEQINRQIHLYLRVQVITGAIVGIATWIAFLIIGLENAAVWGLLAAVLNCIPYLGSILVTGGAALLGLLQFGSLEMALLVGGVSFVLQSLEGYLLTPWLTSRASRINAVIIFVGVLFWGWLWGVWGLLLGVPIIMAFKAVCDHVEDLKPLGEMLEA